MSLIGQGIYLFKSTMSTQIDIATIILATLLTGGFILFFVENQHVENDVIHRYHSLMDPYYHKLSLYLKFVYFINSRMSYSDLNVGYSRDFKSLIDNLAKIGSIIHISGKDVTYKSSEQLESLNKKISNVWYYNDKNPFIRENISFDTTQIFPDMQLIEVLSELSGKYINQSINKNLLPKVSGEFNTEIWEPVDHVTYEFEKWQKKCSSFKKLLITSIVFVMVILVIAMLSVNIFCSILFTLPTILCCVAFVYILFKIKDLMNLSHNIFK